MQAYKHWLIDHSLEDSFESLIEWEETRVQIMEEAREETAGFGKRTFDGPLQEGGKSGFRDKRVSEFVAEPLPPNQSQQVVLLTHLSRNIHRGFA